MIEKWERLQQYLSETHADDVRSTVSLVEEITNESDIVIDRVLYNFLLFLNKRSNNIEYFASVLTDILKGSGLFKTIFLGKFFSEVGPKSSYLAFIPRLRLMKMLIESEAISKEEYNYCLRSFYDKDRSYRYFFIIILIYHEQIISEELKEFFEKILKEDFESDYLPLPLRIYYQIKSDTYNKCANDILGESIREAILNDDAAALAAICNSDPNFKMDRRMESSVFEVNPIVQSSPSMIAYAAYYGSVKCFRMLFLKKAGIELEDGLGRNLTEFAIAGGNTEIIRLLEEHNLTMLHSAAEYFRSEIFDWAALHFDIDINHSDRKLSPLLHRCVAANNVIGTKWCLEHGSNPKLYYREMTPLHVAARFDSAEAAKVLLAHEKVDSMATNIDGDTPLHVAARHGSLAVLRELLMTPFIDVNIGDSDGKTPLHVAVETGAIEVVRMLVRNPSTDLSAIDSIGMKPYMMALHIKRKDIGNIILEAITEREKLK